MRPARLLSPMLLVVTGVAVACEDKGPRATSADASALAASVSASAPPESDGAAPPDASASADSDAAPARTGPCPDGMSYVDTTFCSKVQRECVEEEYDKINHLPICHHFKKGFTKCIGKEDRRQFCIDQYEYPNKKDAHPAWMLDWSQAQATCESKGKRLCYASEWTAACEGPDHTPFPYGWDRDHDKCNIDNFFIEVRKAPGIGFVQYSKDKAIRDAELARLDQSVRSGSMPACVSGFGVYDMTGNFDEWVTSDEPPREKSRWSAFKGGAWGHVRNACRPMTTSHYPHETYYFWSFRCCKDADGAPAWRPPPEDKGGPVQAPAVEPHDFAPDPVEPVNPSGPSKTKYGDRRPRQ